MVTIGFQEKTIHSESIGRRIKGEQIFFKILVYTVHLFTTSSEIRYN